jgi:hypothetical protein
MTWSDRALTSPTTHANLPENRDMKVKWHWVSAAILALVLILQAVPVERTNPPVGRGPLLPPDVEAILRRSCYDCHSNETAWPWYSYLAPVSWIVTDHVNEGREHLNFSTWNEYEIDDIEHMLEEMAEEVEDGTMPLPSYVRLHRDARLSDSERETLIRWAAGGG